MVTVHNSLPQPTLPADKGSIHGKKIDKDTVKNSSQKGARILQTWRENGHDLKVMVL